MALVPFETLPDSSRVWVFGSDRPLAEEATATLMAAVEGYLADWNAHGEPLTAAYEWRFGRLLVIGVDQRSAGASGCSIDGYREWQLQYAVLEYAVLRTRTRWEATRMRGGIASRRDRLVFGTGYSVRGTNYAASLPATEPRRAFVGAALGLDTPYVSRTRYCRGSSVAHGTAVAVQASRIFEAQLFRAGRSNPSRNEPRSVRLVSNTTLLFVIAPESRSALSSCRSTDCTSPWLSR